MVRPSHAASVDLGLLLGGCAECRGLPVAPRLWLGQTSVSSCSDAVHFSRDERTCAWCGDVHGLQEHVWGELWC